MSNIIKSTESKLLKKSDRLITLKNLKTSQENEQISAEDQIALDNYSVSIVEDAKNRASTLIQEAQQKYEELQQMILFEKESWETEKQLLIKQANEEGFNIGYADGRKIGLSSYNELLENGKQIVEIARKDSLKHIENTEEIILSLGIKVAEKIIGEQLNTEPLTYLSIVKTAIKEVKDHAQIQITVHPKYYEVLVDSTDDLKALINRDCDVFVFPNPDLDEIGCFIESSYGKIEASVDSQLEEIKSKLLALLLEE
ncbi:flagellar assembly protein FliH [Litchfieldia alkalitelluris]|uniref:flagellar assembly protein FliH n=1 Tax=Litchfieldia alkalitelluris TaxID=304268 RepID=UPI0014758794|nr:flagellar assembly protein FliH [Litchfieldia alkalitelluris]